MFRKLSGFIVDWQIQTKCLSEKERAIYQYGYELLLNQIVNILFAVVIAILFQDLWTVLLFLSCYIPLRSYAGGYHANTNLGCTVVSAFMLCMLCGLMKLPVAEWIGRIYPICFLISGYCIFAYAPVQDKNKPLDYIEIVRYKKRSRLLWGIETLAGMGLFLLRFPYGAVIAASHIILSIVLFAGLAKNCRYSGEPV